MEPGETHMRRALALAQSAIGLASPNPTVGCVLTVGDKVIGEGAHLYDGRDHAEIVALKSAFAAGHSPIGDTAWVTLEPCSHQGRTGPCADALIAAGISRCVVATADPNPQVSGRGIAKLRAAGIAVEVGLFQAEARALNNAFACSITRGRPFVTLKAALSVDGYLAPPPDQRTAREPVWLTGPESRAEVQRLRHASDAILTGIGTVLADDPLLTDRTGLPRRRPLQRIVLDSTLRTPPSSALARSTRNDLWIFTREGADPSRRSTLEKLGIRVTALATLEIAEVLAHLHQAQLLSVLLEGGSAINASFLSHSLVDEAVLFYSPSELGAGSIPFAAGTPGPFALEQILLSVSKRTFGPDVCVSGLLQDPWASLPEAIRH